MAKYSISYAECENYIKHRIPFKARDRFFGYIDHNGDYVLQSYRTTIAKITTKGIVWVTTRGYSNTTSRHLSHIANALRGEDIVWSSSFEEAKSTTKWRDLALVA